MRETNSLRPVRYLAQSVAFAANEGENDLTDEIWTIREELCKDGKNPAALAHDRLDQRCNAL